MTEYKRILCLSCKMRFDTDDEFGLHPCHPVFKMKDGKLSAEVSEILQLKRTRWGRFLQRLYSVDISFWLAVLGLMLMNAIFVTHLHLHIGEAIIDGLGLGLAIPRLLK